MRPEHAQKRQVAVARYQTTDAPQGKATGINRQYSISPRTIAKFICKKIHCNVLFRPPPPKLVGFLNLF